MSETKYRWMMRSDIFAVLKIEEKYPSPWREENLLRYMQQRNILGCVATHEETVAGFIVYCLGKHTIRIMRLKSSKEQQGRKTDIFLLDRIKSELGDKIGILSADVEDNDIPFFEQQGFRTTSVIIAKRLTPIAELPESDLCVKFGRPHDKQGCEQGYTVLLPDTTSTSAIGWTVEYLESIKRSVENGERQTEFDVAIKALKKEQIRKSNSPRVKEVAGIVTVADEGFLRIKRVIVTQLWADRAAVVKEILIETICYNHGKPPFLAELEESDLPLYRRLGFVPVARVMNFKSA